MISNQLTTDRYDRLVITTWRTWDITLSYFAVSLQREIRNQETLWRLHRATLRLVTAIRVEGLLAWFTLPSRSTSSLVAPLIVSRQASYLVL
jgi:hypothetical protein